MGKQKDLGLIEQEVRIGGRQEGAMIESDRKGEEGTKEGTEVDKMRKEDQRVGKDEKRR